MTAITPIISAVTEILGRFPEVRLAMLYGSCANGTATADSDLDLALLSKAPPTPRPASGLSAILQNDWAGPLI